MWASKIFRMSKKASFVLRQFVSVSLRSSSLQFQEDPFFFATIINCTKKEERILIYTIYESIVVAGSGRRIKSRMKRNDIKLETIFHGLLCHPYQAPHLALNFQH